MEVVTLPHIQSLTAKFTNTTQYFPFRVQKKKKENYTDSKKTFPAFGQKRRLQTTIAVLCIFVTAALIRWRDL